MKIYIVALNEGEWAHQAYLCELNTLAKNTIAHKSRAFKTLEEAEVYAKEWSSEDQCPLSTRVGSGGITIFTVEMNEP